VFDTVAEAKRKPNATPAWSMCRRRALRRAICEAIRRSPTRHRHHRSIPVLDMVKVKRALSGSNRA
jgi:hypothetical protein